MVWDTVVFVALVGLLFMVHTAAAFSLGLTIGIARTSARAFRRGWDAAAANLANHPRE